MDDKQRCTVEEVMAGPGPFYLVTESGRILPTDPVTGYIDARPITIAIADDKEYSGPYFVPWG